jgi:hypothetical protein
MASMWGHRVRPIEEADIIRSATRNGTTRLDKRPGEDDESRRAAEVRRPASDAERQQEQLWADCIAKDPEILSDIVNFIETERTRIIESPPVAPTDDTKPDRS